MTQTEFFNTIEVKRLNGQRAPLRYSLKRGLFYFRDMPAPEKNPPTDMPYLVVRRRGGLTSFRSHSQSQVQDKLLIWTLLQEPTPDTEDEPPDGSMWELYRRLLLANKFIDRGDRQRVFLPPLSLQTDIEPDSDQDTGGLYARIPWLERTFYG